MSHPSFYWLLDPGLKDLCTYCQEVHHMSMHEVLALPEMDQESNVPPKAMRQNSVTFAIKGWILNKPLGMHQILGAYPADRILWGLDWLKLNQQKQFLARWARSETQTLASRVSPQPYRAAKFLMSQNLLTGEDLIQALLEKRTVGRMSYKIQPPYRNFTSTTTEKSLKHYRDCGVIFTPAQLDAMLECMRENFLPEWNPKGKVFDYQQTKERLHTILFA